MAKNIDFMGAIFPDVPSVKLPQQGGGLVAFDDTTDATATADKILSGYTAYAGGQKLTGTASGGITPSGTYSITSNGIYDIVSFASVDVQVSGGGGGDHDAEDGLITRAISGVYENSRVTSVGALAFASCTSLATVSFPNVTFIGAFAFSACSNLTSIYFPNVTFINNNAFQICSKLASANFPNVTSISGAAFQNCYDLSTISFPNVTSISGNAFGHCSKLTNASLPNALNLGQAAFASCTSLATVRLDNVTSIGNQCFKSCVKLESVYILASSVPTMTGSTVFGSTPMSLSSYLGHFGSIYVPASLVSSYKTARNWSYYADRITSYEG